MCSLLANGKLNLEIIQPRKREKKMNLKVFRKNSLHVITDIFHNQGRE